MSTIKTNTLQNVAGTLSVPVSTVVNGSAKAWVNFNGTGTVAIRAAFNVSSITDNGTGDYTVNFTSAVSDSNYSVSTATAPLYAGLDYGWNGVGTLTTSSVKIKTTNSTGTARDEQGIFVTIFR